MLERLLPQWVACSTMYKRWLQLLILLLLGAGCVVLYLLVDPVGSVWMPKCPFRLLTGWNCPACGFQRALHAFLNGHFREALAYNYFLLIGLPYLLALAAVEVLEWWGRGGRFAWWVTRPVVAKVYIVLFCVWWVLRNVWGL